MVRKRLMPDEALDAILDNLKKVEVLLLAEMKKNRCIAPQMSVDESKLINMVNEMTPYKIKFTVSRLSVCNLISDTKQGITRYYLTPDGLRLLELFQQNLEMMNSTTAPSYIGEVTVLQEDTSLEEDETVVDETIEEEEIRPVKRKSSSTKKKRRPVRKVDEE